MAGDEDDGLHYSDMTQDVCWYRLAPGWKAQALQEGVLLEDLPAGAVN